MKGLWKYISPFAPDQSGAASVFYGLQGIVVICDAGGCAGNICGFDEPRWFSGRKSAVFSAGLRDMDAIMGRDDRLVAKICQAVDHVQAAFIAIVGTPVPSVIGTDYQALKRMIAKKVSIPVITVDTTGMGLYDKGMEAAYKAVCSQFIEPLAVPKKNMVGVWGAIPLEFMHPMDGNKIVDILQKDAVDKVVLFDCLDDYRQAGAVTKNIVISPAGLEAAQYVYKIFGIPYECRYFGNDNLLTNDIVLQDKSVLIVHQQVAALDMAKKVRALGAKQVITASWFMVKKELLSFPHIYLKEEDDFCQLVQEGSFDVIIGDIYFKRAIPHFTGVYIDYPHFAVSGRE